MAGESPWRADVAVVGGGIAGVSVAYELAGGARVLLLEAEEALAHHATGRSAAMFLQTYGGRQVRALTAGSRSFFQDPPAELSVGAPLTSPRPLLQVARPGRGHRLEELLGQVSALVPDARLLAPDEAADRCPVLRPEAVEAALLEPHAEELDVHALHLAYAKGVRARGGRIVRSCRVDHLERTAGGWSVQVAGTEVARAEVVVDAAGAWGDPVAAAAGARPVGLVPRRRTVFTVPGEGLAAPGLPLLYDVDETFYLKPEGETFLASPADRTPVDPHDAAPDQLQIARSLDDIRAATTLSARSVRRSWAGLRTFAPDEEFVVGADPAVPGFFWLVGQGGYGIQTAPATARLAASLVHGEAAPEDLVRLGLDPEALDPGRFAGQT